jgi:hypothetical protein
MTFAGLHDGAVLFQSNARPATLKPNLVASDSEIRDQASARSEKTLSCSLCFFRGSPCSKLAVGYWLLVFGFWLLVPGSSLITHRFFVLRGSPRPSAFHFSFPAFQLCPRCPSVAR